MSKTIVQEQFGKNAAGYLTSTPHALGKSLERLVALTAPQPSWRALDVATGGGHVAYTFAPHVERMWATDITQEMLDLVKGEAAKRGLSNIRTAHAKAEALPFEDASFDLVTCRIAPHHFPDVRTALSEMTRVTRPGGRIGIIDSVVPYEPSLDAFLNGIEKVRDPSHVRSYRVEEWLEFLAGAGLLLLQAASLWKTHAFPEWVARTGRPKAVQREVETIFLSAFPLARETFRIRAEGGRVVSYSDEKAIFVARKPGGAPPP